MSRDWSTFSIRLSDVVLKRDAFKLQMFSMRVRCRVSILGVTALCGVEGPGIEPRHGQAIFLFSKNPDGL